MSIYKSKHGIWLIEGDTHRTVWVEEKGSLYIDALIGFICDYINEGDTVVDVGANIGDHTFFYKEKVGANGRILAFEPDHDAFACLLLNCGYSKDFYEAGLGKSEENANIIRHGNSGQNYLEPGDGSIKIITLDSLNLDKCNLIKIDVEGAELEVLKGASETIKKFKPVIVLEVIEEQLHRFNTTKGELMAYLHDLGYTIIKSLRPDETIDNARDILCTQGI